MLRAAPWLGAIVAVATVGASVRRKGWFRGTLDAALDATPFIGGAKNLAEAARGRDFIRNKPLAVVPDTGRRFSRPR
jgi:hypothetical protein